MSNTKSKARPKFLRALLVTFLAMLPIAGGWIYKVHIYPRPFWIHFYDPEAAYYYDGAQLVNGELPSHVGHPGTPVQVLSAVIQIFVGSNPLDYDRFRLWAYTLAGLLTFGAALLLAWQVLANLPVTLQMTALWTYFICPQALTYNNIWSPEILYFPFGAILVIVCWRFLRKELSYLPSLTIGASVGLCCALKLAFLAWLPALALTLLIAKKDNKINRFTLVTVGLVGLAIGFITGTIVIVKKYPLMLNWFWTLVSRSGYLGSEDNFFPDLATMLRNLWNYLVSVRKLTFTDGVFKYSESMFTQK